MEGTEERDRLVTNGPTKSNNRHLTIKGEAVSSTSSDDEGLVSDESSEPDEQDDLHFEDSDIIQLVTGAKIEDKEDLQALDGCVRHFH